MAIIIIIIIINFSFFIKDTWKCFKSYVRRCSHVLLFPPIWNKYKRCAFQFLDI